MVPVTHDISLELCIDKQVSQDLTILLDTVFSEEQVSVFNNAGLLIKTEYYHNGQYNDTPCQHISLKTVDEERRDFNIRYFTKAYGGNVSVTITEANINGLDYYVYHINGDSTNLLRLSTCIGDADLVIELWEPLNIMRIANSIRLKIPNNKGEL